MPFIDRDETGKIKGVYTLRQYEGQEWIKEDNPEVTAFLNPMPTYRELRARAYPPIADQLDAIWQGEPLTGEMRNKVMAVKAKYPKI